MPFSPAARRTRRTEGAAYRALRADRSRRAASGRTRAIACFERTCRSPFAPLMSSRPLLPESSLAPHVSEKIQSFHRNVVDAITAAIARDPVVVVGMAQNPFVKKARRALETAGVPFTYLEYGS